MWDLFDELNETAIIISDYLLQEQQKTIGLAVTTVRTTT